MPSQTENSRRLTQAIMDQCVLEEPSYWPYGCRVGMHDAVYLVREKCAHTPVGWVGWQVRSEADGTRTGLYSVGLLPQYRGQGYAKEAVQKLLQAKSATVDQVRAFIMPHNTKSLKLAERLNVPVVTKLASTKQAFMAAARRLLTSPAARSTLGAAVGAGAGMAENEYLYDPAMRSLFDDPKAETSHLTRYLNPALGALTGMVAGAKGPIEAAKFYIPKVLAVGGTEAGMQYLKRHGETMQRNLETARFNRDTASAERDTAQSNAATAKNIMPILLAALGLGTAGLGIYGAQAWNQRRKPKKPARTDVIKGDPNAPRPQKVRIDVPAGSLPPEFFNSLINADDQERALMTARTKSSSSDQVPEWQAWLHA